MPEPDPLQARSPLTIYVFSLYLRYWYLRRSFRAVRLLRGGLPQAVAGRPLIIYSNHPSWWDPLMFVLLSRRVLRGRLGFGPMEAASLGRYGLLRRLGVFGIDPHSAAGAARFLRTGLQVLADPRAALWVTAEGSFTDPRRRPLILRPGVAHLVRRVPQAVVLPLALEYPFWNERRPEALAHFGPAVELAGAESVAEVTARLEAALTETVDRLAVASQARNPALFSELLHGRVGMGGIYDLWRRAVSLAHGRHFDPRHEA